MRAPTPGRRWRMPTAVAVIAVLLALALVWLVLFSRVFAAREVVVEGTDQVTPTQVRAAAQVPTDMALARLPLDAISARVETLDSVASAIVVRDWPDAVRIVVTERRPVAVVDNGARFGVVGSDEVVYRTESTRPAGLPLLDELPAGAIANGASTAAFRVATLLPDPVRSKVIRISAASGDSVQLQLRSGARVEWGSAASTERKAQVLLLLLPKRAAHYDVSAPDAPAWTGKS